MSDTTTAPVSDESGNRTLAIICYALFIATFMNGLSAIVGVVLAYIKRDDARGTIWESHFRNLIHVFWASIAMTVLLLLMFTGGAFGIFTATQTDSFNGAIALMPLGGIAGVLFLAWYLYRTIKGLIHAVDRKPYI
jgi:uncharacterized membrane protein